MNYLISIGWYVFPIIPINKILELIEIYDKNKKIKGFEIASADYVVMEKMLKFAIKNNLTFQCHAPKRSNDLEILSYLDNLGKLSQIYNKKINVVFHSKEDDNLNLSIINTKVFLKKVLNYINDNNLNISISLENLNFHHNHNRINIDKIDTILMEFDDLNFTYDIGHDIFDNHSNSKLSALQIQRLNNIHIHNVHNNLDHCEITLNCDYIEALKNSIKYLKKINYTGNIVLETGINRYSGNSPEEQLINYIQAFNSIEKIIN